MPETGTKKNQVQQKLKFKAIAVKKNRVLLTLGQPNYPWKDNSCWLDTSLKLTFVSVMWHFLDFATCCKSLSADSGLHSVLKSFERWQLIRSDDPNCSDILGNQHDEICTMLKEKKLADDLDGTQPLFVSFLVIRGYSSLTTSPGLGVVVGSGTSRTISVPCKCLL
jgi:hypothetical protein